MSCDPLVVKYHTKEPYFGNNLVKTKKSQFHSLANLIWKLSTPSLRTAALTKLILAINLIGALSCRNVPYKGFRWKTIFSPSLCFKACVLFCTEVIKQQLIEYLKNDRRFI